MQLRRSRLALAGLVFASMMPLTACSTGTAEPTASPTPTSVPSATPAEAVVAFGGDCSAALSEDEVATAAQVGAADLDSSVLTAAYAPYTYRIAGGILCVWNLDGGQTVVLTAFPASLVPDDVAARVANPMCDEVAGECAASTTAAGAWLVVEHYAATVPDAATALLAAAAGRVGQAPAAAERADTWWSVADCHSLAAQVDLTDYLGEVPAAVSWFEAPSIGDQVLAASGFLLPCIWQADAGYLTVRLYPGGADEWSDFVAAAQPADGTQLAGADEAYSWTTGGSRFAGTIAVDGVNVLAVRSPDVDTASVAADLLGAL